MVMDMVPVGMAIGRARCPQRAVRWLTNKPPYQSNANRNSVRYNKPGKPVAHARTGIEMRISSYPSTSGCSIASYLNRIPHTTREREAKS